METQKDTPPMSGAPMQIPIPVPNPATPSEPTKSLNQPPTSPPIFNVAPIQSKTAGKSCTIIATIFVLILVFIILGVFMLFRSISHKVPNDTSVSFIENIAGSLGDQSGSPDIGSSNDGNESGIVPVTSDQVMDNIKCDNEYNVLIEKNGRTYGKGCFAGIGGMECEQPTKANLPKNVVMILDSSGSMAANMGGRTKLDVAKEAAENFVKDLKEDINISIVAYGHKGSNNVSSKAVSCSGIEEIYWLGAPNLNIINDKIGAMKATGWTPIEGALQKAKDILSKYPTAQYNNSVLLISDGEETCNGDPVAKAKELNTSDINVVVNVVGFDVGGKAESQLKSTAVSGNGTYFSARNASELSAALGDVTAKCLRKGKVVAQVQANSSVLINCQALLGAEWVNMITDINKASSECRAYIMNKYDERYKSLKTQFEELDAQNKKNFKDAYGKDSTTSN